jgi:cysteine desulfurase / selenocysteine lyase
MMTVPLTTAPTDAAERRGAFDPLAIRARFPILNAPGAPLIYLDSAATSQKPEAVLDAMDRYYRTCNANIHRGVYRIAEEATARYEDARRRVADFIGAASPAEVVFTRNATEAINLVAHSWARRNLQSGDVVLLTEMEHHANLVPWHILAEERGITVKYIPVTGDGFLDLDEMARTLAQSQVKLVGTTHISNVLGTVNPIAEIAAQAHEAGALLVVDAAQSVPHLKMDVRALGADFVAFTGHKMLGPTGIGVLWARRKLLESMPPFLGGGEMIREVTLEGSKWNDVPWKFEAGTMPIAEAVGLGAAVEFLESLGMDAIWRHDRELVAYAMTRLAEVPDLKILGPGPDARGAAVAFTLDNIHAHDVATVLDASGVCVRAGHHCAMPLHTKLGIPSSARASFHCYSTRADVDALIAGLERARQVFA